MLLGVTGGIAAYKAAFVARLLTGAGAGVSVVMTESAQRFIGTETFSGLTGAPAHTSLWERPGEILHVSIARDADIAVVAPATANLIAKLANGIADDLLSTTLLEFTGTLVVAPAMHTGMWEHPATRANVEKLVQRGAFVVGPAEGPLAHGDEGLGRMAEPEEILKAIEAALGAGDLSARRIVVSAGPTWEPLDPVRFVGNRSSGKMGVAVAREAAVRGADVVLVLGPGTVPPPAGVTVIRVQTAQEMHEAVIGAAAGADATVMAAAVADFRPKAPADTKIKRNEGAPQIVLEPTPDILAELRHNRVGGMLVGFAAETSDTERLGREKLIAKGIDLLVANTVGREGTGFGSDSNEAAILSATGDDVALRRWTKAELASAICDIVSARLTDEASPGN